MNTRIHTSNPAHKNRTDPRSGAAVLLALGIISIVSIVCGYLGFTASQQMRMMQITRDMIKAKMIAETGLNIAYNRVKNDFSVAPSIAFDSAFSDGRFVVISEAVASNEQRYKLKSVGYCGLGQHTVSADIENRVIVNTEDPDDRVFTLDYNLLVGGALSMTGNFYAGVGSIHANGAVTMNGSSSVNSTTISSSSSVTLKRTTNITALPNQPQVAIQPDTLSAAISALKDYAQQNGAVYASGADIPASPPGGIAWCTGSDTGWSGVGTGCFIFDGAFSSKHLTLQATDGYPALVVTSANALTLNAGTTINGALILPTSSLKVNGHTTIYGAIVIGQNVTGNGTADIYAGTGPGFNLPPKENLTDNVVITAWY